MTEQDKEVKANYEAFQEKLPILIFTHRGKFALMRQKKIVEFFDTFGDACTAGGLLYPDDGLYSVQEVAGIPVHLRAYYALHQR